MPAVLKLSYEGEMRRVIMDKDISYENICGAVANAWPEVKDLTAKYADEEGDLCVFCEASFTDFLAISTAMASGKASEQLVLRLEFAAGEAVPCGGKGGQEQVPAETWGPFPHGKAGGHGHHVRGHRKGHGKMFLKKHGHGHHDHIGWESKHGKHGHGEGKWDAHKLQGQEWLKPKKMLWLMTQLHACEALSSPAAVSLWVYLLPQALQVFALNPEEAGRKLRKKLPNIKTLLQNFTAATKEIEGLEQCETIILQILTVEEATDSSADASVGELLVSLLTAVDALRFEEQVKFFEVFFELQKDGLHELLDSWKSWCCEIPLDHHGVQCASCGMAPLRGLRFKSTTCEGLDLCSECFCKKTNLAHGENEEEQEFKLIPVDWANMYMTKQESWGECKDAWKAWMKGKGKCKKGKGKGKDKGKGKGKDKGKSKGKGKCCKRSAWDAELDQVAAKKCARPGCNFQCTWHPTHCCHACAQGPDKHGPKCDKSSFPVVAPILLEDVPWELLEVEETELKAKKLEEMGFGTAAEMTEVLKNHGGDLTKSLESLRI